MTTIRWDSAPAGVTVAFTGRTGGVSEGAFASLNLGALTDDDPEAVRENRRRAVDAVGADPDRRHHGVAGGGGRGAGGDGDAQLGSLHASRGWSRSPSLGRSGHLTVGQAVGVAGSRLPSDRDRPHRRIAIGRAARGLAGTAGGHLRAGSRPGRAGAVAMVGPGAGPCCYKVKDDVGKPLQAAFGEPAVRDGCADLWYAARTALERAGVEQVEVAGRCTICAPRSTSRTGAIAAAPAVRGWSVSLVPDPAVIAANLARIRSEVGPEVEILAATKYVDADGMQALLEAGVTLVGENRSDALAANRSCLPTASPGISSAICSAARCATWSGGCA